MNEVGVGTGVPKTPDRRASSFGKGSLLIMIDWLV